MKKKLFTEIPKIKGGRLVLKGVTPKDEPMLRDMVEDPEVYRYLPTFLYEKKYEDLSYVISHLYDECLQESLILGIYMEDELCGLIELYGYRDPIHKISIGYRLRRKFWGLGVAPEAAALLIRYLYEETDIEIITASIMSENSASARAAEKNGFSLVVKGAKEDWGFEEPVTVDKWIR